MTEQSTIPVVVGLNATLLAVTGNHPRVLVLGGAGCAQPSALPFGMLDSHEDRTLELALRRWVKTKTGLDLGYVEQLYSFGDKHRDPEVARSGQRVISIAYLALMREDRQLDEEQAHWANVYEFLPWEDRRKGPWPGIESTVRPAINSWIEQSPDLSTRHARELRSQMAFGGSALTWDGERVLERCELLYELGLLQESHTYQGVGLGRLMAKDHRRILATALGRLRGKIRYRPVIFEMLPDEFTLLQLQKAVEALSGLVLHKQNFRRLVEQTRLVEGTDKVSKARGRPAELFRFRHDVLRERPAPGLGLPRSGSGN